MLCFQEGFNTTYHCTVVLALACPVIIIARELYAVIIAGLASLCPFRAVVFNLGPRAFFGGLQSETGKLLNKACSKPVLTPSL